MRPALQRLTTAGFVLALALAVGIALLVAQTLDDMLDSSERVEHTLQVQKELERLYMQVRTAQSAARGYALVGDEASLAFHKQGVDGSHGQIAVLRRLTFDNPAQQQALNELDETISPYFAHLGRVIEARRAGGLTAAQALLVGGAGQPLIVKARGHIDAMLREEERLLGLRRQAMAAEIRDTWILIGGAGTAMLALLAWSFVTVRRDSRRRREAERRLKALNETLEQQVAARTAEAQESEARMRNLFEQAADGIFIITPDHRYLDANAEGLRMLGYSREELLGLHVWDVLAEHERPRLAVEVAAMMAGTPHLAEWEHLRKDGTTFPAEVSARAHSPVQYLAIVRDMTARRQAEQALREAHDLFRDMALLAADYVWELDENLRFSEITPAPRISGRFDGASLIGKTRWDLPYLGVDEARWAPHRADLEARRPFRDLELSMRNLKGEERWFLTSGDPVFAANGRFRGYRGTSVDITELKQNEVRLHDYSIRLETLSRKLMRVQEDERRALARELHDEVGQALTALKLNLAALRRWFSEEARLAVLDDCIGLVEDTIGQIRDRSLDLRPPMLDDVGLAGTLQWYASRFAKRSGLTVAADIAALPERPTPEVESAAFRIAQEALTNVLRHAGARRADIRLETENHSLVLTVRDDGRGFDPVAVRPGEAGEGGGTGLVGMRERVGLLGGEMVIDSAPGRGTEIRVRLPLHPEKPQ